MNKSNWLERAKQFLRRPDKAKSPVPLDGTYVATETPGVMAYTAAPDRMKSSPLVLPSMNPQTFEGHKPSLLRSSKALRWEYVKELDGKFVGLTLLKDEEATLLVLKYATYVLPISDGSAFLAYQRDPETKDDQRVLTLHLVNTADLQPLDPKSQDSENRIYYRSSNSTTEQIVLKPDQFKFTHEFSQNFRDIPEFLLVQNIEWLRNEPKNLSDSAILVVRPNESSVEILPQDWFNQSDKMDFGYQWITMAARDPQTGLIHGFGIRLTNFVLDKTGRNLVNGGDMVIF